MRPAHTIATAAGLAVVVFVVGALGPGGSRDAKSSRAPAVAAPADAFLAPATAAGSLDASIASLESKVEAQPDDWKALAALGIAYVQRARITSDPSTYPLAQVVLSRSLKLHPAGNAAALLGLGTLAAARHHFTDALRWGRRAVKAAPYDADVYGLVGDAQLELGRYGAAFGSFQRMIDIRPNLASYARVSYALELRGNVDGAIAAMRAAYDVAARPADTAWAAAHIAKIHFGAGRIDEAEKWFRRARAADPGSMDAEAGLALIAWASGDLEKAIAGYERLASRYPSPEHVAVLGDLYAAPGDREAAAAQYELVRAEARLFRANGVDTDLEIALFEADHRGALGAGGASRRPRRVVPASERPRRGRLCLGALRERRLPEGLGLVGRGPPPRHPQRALPVPRGDDPACVWEMRPPRGPSSDRRSTSTRPSRSGGPRPPPDALAPGDIP